MVESRTIAAIATAVTTAGIGIIRISGHQAIAIADQIFKGKNNKRLIEQKSHTVHYGWICDGSEIIDEVLIIVMKGPNSYTAEDTIEIDCHGGILVVNKILELVIKNGAEIAEPGEFTKKAFLNGRIDLSQAEAVIDLINSKNSYAMKSSINQLVGSVSNEVKNIRKSILFHIAYIESALDDPEHISLDGYPMKLNSEVSKLVEKIKKLLDSSGQGRFFSEGVKTVIVGRPNVGKSSLMNLLMGEERAIVTEIAGTTRDTLEEHIYLKGISLNIVDTAGIHETEDIVEKIGISKAKLTAEDADLIIYVVDASTKLDQNDEVILNMIKGQNVIVLLNKIDLESKVEKSYLENKTGYPVIEFSAKENHGLDVLEDKIKEMFYQGEINFNDQIYITNLRHINMLEKALNSLIMVMNSINIQMPEDFYSIDLMDAYKSLGIIIGESVEDDLVNEIFEKFCMGK